MSTTTEAIPEVQAAQQGSLLDEIMAQTRIAPSDEGYHVAKKGIAAFVENLIGSNQVDDQINKSLVDQMLVELDKKISAQMDEILHQESYQQMESSWRGLKLFIDRTDFRENNKVDLLHATKAEAPGPAATHAGGRDRPCR